MKKGRRAREKKELQQTREKRTKERGKAIPAIFEGREGRSKWEGAGVEKSRTPGEDTGIGNTCRRGNLPDPGQTSFAPKDTVRERRGKDDREAEKASVGFQKIGKLSHKELHYLI